MAKRKRSAEWIDENVLLLLTYFKSVGLVLSAEQVRAVRQFVESGDKEIVLPMSKDNTE